MALDPKKYQARRKREQERAKQRAKTDPEYRQRRREAWKKYGRKQRAIIKGLSHIPEGQQLNRTSLLTDEQSGELQASWVKTIQETDETKTIQPPPDFTVDRVSTYTHAGETRAQWVSYDRSKADEWAAIQKAMREATEEYRGLAAPVPAPECTDARLLNVLAVGDPHFSMLAWAEEAGQDFDGPICRDNLLKAARLVIARSPRAKTLLIAELGDFFHAEDDEARTPRGKNPLDVDTRAGKTTRNGFLLMRALIDAGLETHDVVYVVILRGNHDPYKSLALALYLTGVYENDPRVHIVDNNDPFLFHEHGINLLGFHHGDGARPEQLPGIMAAWKDGVPWGRARFRMWLTGHVHEKYGIKGFPGVLWESFRTMAPTDYWAHWKGYRSEQQIECLTFDEVDGLVSRQVVTLRMVKLAGGEK